MTATANTPITMVMARFGKMFSDFPPVSLLLTSIINGTSLFSPSRIMDSFPDPLASGEVLILASKTVGHNGLTSIFSTTDIETPSISVRIVGLRVPV